MKNEDPKEPQLGSCENLFNSGTMYFPSLIRVKLCN